MPRIYTHEWVILRFRATPHPPVYQLLSYCQVAVAPQLTSQLYSQTSVLGCKMEPVTKGSSKEQLCTPALMHWNRMSQKREDSGKDFACSTGAISYPSLIPPEIDRTLISSGDACDCLLMASRHGWAVRGWHGMVCRFGQVQRVVWAGLLCQPGLSSN